MYNENYVEDIREITQKLDEISRHITKLNVIEKDSHQAMLFERLIIARAIIGSVKVAIQEVLDEE